MILIGNGCLTIMTKINMRKIYSLMVALIAVSAIVSCNKELVNDEDLGVFSEITFTAVSEVATKTAIGDKDENNARPVTWISNDKITVNGVEFYTEAGGAEARFVTKNLDFTAAEQYNAIYPATAGASFDAITISASQDGTFANASISVAQSEDQYLEFKNLASMLKFQVPVACSSVTIESTAPLAGTVSVSFDEAGNPVLGEVSSSSTTIKIEKALATETDYYVAVLPGEHKFTVKINGLTSKASTKTSTIERAKLLNMNTLPDDNFLYLVPNSNWKSDGSRYAAYFFESGEKWVDMVKFTDDLYACEKQSGFAKVIFARMNASDPANNWNTKYDQTADLTIGTQKYCIIPFDVWGGSTIWSDNATYSTSGKYYLVPNYNWKSSDAWFATYFFNNSTGKNTWVKMTKISDNPAYYEVIIPSGTWPNLIFCRMNSSKTTMDWNSVWNQTNDLAKQNSNNFYTIGAGAWSKGSGSWSKK